MKVKVTYFNVLRDAIGKKEEDFETENELDLTELIKLIGQKYHEDVSKLLFQDNGTIAPYIRVFVDNNSIYDLEHKLRDGAEIALFFAVIGG